LYSLDFFFKYKFKASLVISATDLFSLKTRKRRALCWDFSIAAKSVAGSLSFY